MARRTVTAETRVFFEPFQLDLQPPDLLVEFWHPLELLVLGPRAGLLEDRRPALHQPLLPVVDLAGMHRVVARQLVDGVLLTKRVQGHLGLELRRVRLAFLRHHVPLWTSGG